MLDLLESYRNTLSMVNEAKNKAIESDAKILSNVETSLRYCITWLETGFEPLPTDISKYSHSRREILIDPVWQTKFKAAKMWGDREDISKKNQELLNDLLGTLTPKEKEALLLTKGAGFTFSETARIMNYKSKGSVERLVTSAEEKLRLTASRPPDGDDIFLLKSVQMIMSL